MAKFPIIRDSIISALIWFIVSVTLFTTMTQLLKEALRGDYAVERRAEQLLALNDVTANLADAVRNMSTPSKHLPTIERLSQREAQNQVIYGGDIYSIWQIVMIGSALALWFFFALQRLAVYQVAPAAGGILMAMTLPDAPQPTALFAMIAVPWALAVAMRRTVAHIRGG